MYNLGVIRRFLELVQDTAFFTACSNPNMKFLKSYHSWIILLSMYLNVCINMPLATIEAIAFVVAVLRAQSSMSMSI
jgi:hypothetical protein